MTADVDTVSVWLGTTDATSFSRGEFGVVGTRRLLTLYERYGITGTFFVPGLTAQLYGDLVGEIVSAGHEIGHHGHHHENPMRLGRDGEAEVLAKGFEALGAAGAPRPVGWRSPAWAVSPHSLDLLVEHGFSYDSSLMGHDTQPYWCRSGDEWSRETGVTWGAPIDLVEVPIAWHLDDFPWFEHVPRGQGNLTAPSAVLEAWQGDFRWAVEHEPDGVLTYTMHPQVIGRGGRLLMLETLIAEIASHPNVTFTTLASVAEDFRNASPRPADEQRR